MMEDSDPATGETGTTDLEAWPGILPESGLRHLSPDDLARRWRRSTRTLERWRRARTGPAWLRLHGRVLYRLEDVLAYEQACLEQPSE